MSGWLVPSTTTNGLVENFEFMTMDKMLSNIKASHLSPGFKHCRGQNLRNEGNDVIHKLQIQTKLNKTAALWKASMFHGFGKKRSFVQAKRKRHIYLPRGNAFCHFWLLVWTWKSNKWQTHELWPYTDCNHKITTHSTVTCQPQVVMNTTFYELKVKKKTWKKMQEVVWIGKITQ